MYRAIGSPGLQGSSEAAVLCRKEQRHTGAPAAEVWAGPWQHRGGAELFSRIFKPGEKGVEYLSHDRFSRLILASTINVLIEIESMHNNNIDGSI